MYQPSAQIQPLQSAPPQFYTSQPPQYAPSQFYNNPSLPSYHQSMGMPQSVPTGIPHSHVFGRPAQPNYVVSSSQAPSQAHFAGSTEINSAPFMSHSAGLFLGPHQVSSGLPAASTTSAVSSASPQNGSPWYFDSGATNHITNNLHHVINPQPAAAQDGIMVGNGSHIQVAHTGTGRLSTPSVQFQLNHLLHTPISHITYSLFISLPLTILVL